MRSICALVLVAACGEVVPVAGPFPDIPTTPGLSEYTFEHDGRARRFQIFVPRDHVPERPLVIVLHGGGGNATRMFGTHPLEREAVARGLVIVAAEGTSDTSDTSFEWNNQAAIDDGVDDVGYLEQLVLGVTTSLDIDPARRYLAGFSGGASMAVRFAAEKSPLVTAIGTYAGKVGISIDGAPFVFPPVPTTPLSVMMTYGTDDPNLAGEMKDNALATSGRAGIEWWASSLGCATTPTTTVEGPATFDSYTCPTGLVRMNTIAGMGHTWPEPPEGPFGGTKVVLDFFADKTKP